MVDFTDYKPNIFFMGLNPRWQMYKFLPKKINVMFSAAGFWDGREWRKNCKFSKNFGLTFLDSGGFTLLNKFHDFPFSVINYANLIARLKPDYYATMDYPCEPEISRNLGLLSNDDRIKATIQNAIELAEWENQLHGKLVPVIQGYSLDEYCNCIEQYNKVNLVRDYMAVGSMCRRISKHEIGNLIPGIYKIAAKYGVQKLHFFGLKLSSDLEPLSDFIWSRDSAVALDAYDKNLVKKRNGRRFPRGQTEKKEAFLSFLNRLNTLGLNYTSG